MQKIISNGISYDSKEEVAFSHYVNELIDAGFIEDAFYHPEPFVLSEATHLFVHEDNDKRVKQRNIPILHDHVYTADWKIVWNRRARGIFYWQEGDSVKKGSCPYSSSYPHRFIPFIVCRGVTFIDIKGDYVAGNNASGITFPLNQKWLWTKEGLLVQKIIVSNSDKCIFARTFTPKIVAETETYKYDTKGKWKAGDTKLKYEIRSLEQFLNMKK